MVISQTGEGNLDSDTESGTGSVAVDINPTTGSAKQVSADLGIVTLGHVKCKIALIELRLRKSNSTHKVGTLCPTSRLDVMSHLVDCVFHTSNHKTQML